MIGVGFMNKKIYITYCCKNKAHISKEREVLPAELYLSSRIKNFINFCDTNNYFWAIFSDLYGLVYKNEKIKWYNKPPDSVSKLEYAYLLNLTIQKLENYDEVVFYYEEKSFHSLYKQMLYDIKPYIHVSIVDSLEEYNDQN